MTGALQYGGMTGTGDDTAVARMCALSDDWSETFRLLGDPTRLRLLTVLHYVGPGALSMSELAERADVKVATASAALRLLTAAGVVTADRDGKMMRYELSNERVHRLLHHLGGTHAHTHPR